MGTENDDASVVLAPVGGGVAPLADQRLANTGTTESHNATLLPLGCIGWLTVGATPVRVSWRGAAGASAQVATTDRIRGAYTDTHFKVTAERRCVYIEAADGSSAYEGWVCQSSPGTV